MDNILDDSIEEIEDAEIKDWITFIGKKSDYYVPVWSKIKKGNIFSFNFAAFFIPVFWLLYRKMYIEAILFLLIAFIEGLLTEFVFGITGNNIFINIAYATVMGTLGNYIYYKHTQRKINNIKAKSMGQTVYNLELERVGGTSWKGIIILSILFLLFVLFIIFILL